MSFSLLRRAWLRLSNAAILAEKRTTEEGLSEGSEEQPHPGSTSEQTSQVRGSLPTDCQLQGGKDINPGSIHTAPGRICIFGSSFSLTQETGSCQERQESGQAEPTKMKWHSPPFSGGPRAVFSGPEDLCFWTRWSSRDQFCPPDQDNQ